LAEGLNLNAVGSIGRIDPEAEALREEIFISSTRCVKARPIGRQRSVKVLQRDLVFAEDAGEDESRGASRRPGRRRQQQSEQRADEPGAAGREERVRVFIWRGL